MNGRLFGLYAALQGGTRRKPTYLNVGALVSFLYSKKITDTVGTQFNLLNVAIKDVVMQNYQEDNLDVFAGVTGVVLNDPLKFSNNADTLDTFASVTNLVLVDVVEQSFVNDSISTSMTVIGVVFDDNVKVAGDLTDTISTTAAVTNILLEDV